MKNLIPGYISEKFIKGKYKGNFKGYSMFVDIAGFTNLTETLMKHKKDGAEILTKAINDIFEPIISNIYSGGGYITTFAGDAFTAVFRKADSAINSSFFIKNNSNNVKIKTKYGEFSIGTKIGLSHGNINWGILGGESKHTYFFRGEAIDRCVSCEHNAAKGQVVIDNILYLKLKNKIKAKKIKKGFYNIISTEISENRSKNFSVILKKNIVGNFILDAVMNFTKKAEFRNVACMFISFRSPAKYSDLNDFISLLIESSYEYGGYFNKLDFGDKGGICLIVFGAPVSHENNLERAMNLICYLRNNIKDINFKISLSYGTVYAGFMGGKERSEYTAIGDIVNLSSRIASSEDWGQAMVTETVYKEMQNNFTFIKSGDLEFKGKTGKFPVYSLMEKKEQAKTKLFEGKMYGRTKELKLLRKSINPIFKNSFSGITYIFGEAGIGKSRLVYELKNQIRNDVQWYFLPCESILQKSFNPVTYFLKSYFDVTEDNTKTQNLKNFESRFNSLLKKLKKSKNNASEELFLELGNFKTVLGGYLGFEWKNSLFETLDSRERYENFIYSFKILIKSESIFKPVILEIEDSHIIDQDTAGLIQILIRNIHEFPIGIICTSRYNDKGEQIFIGEGEGDDTDKNIIDLNFLEKTSVSSFVKGLLRADLSPSNDLISFIYRKTNGNPFFIEQLVLDLNDKGYIKIDKKQKHLFVDKSDLEVIPTNIQDVVISRLDRLSEEMKNIIQTASILGREFAVKVLSGILKKDKLLDAKIKLIEDQKIWNSLSEINYIFKHALMRDTAYDMQMRTRLKKLHKLAAENFISIFKNNIEEYYSDIAYHFYRSGIKNKTLYYLEKAGDYSAVHYLNEEALNLFNRFIEVGGNSLSTKKYVNILLKKGEVMEPMGMWKECETMYTECVIRSKKIKDKTYLAKSYMQLGNIQKFKGDYDNAMKNFKKALKIYEDLSDDIGIIRILNHMSIIHYFKSDFKKSLQISEKLMKTAEEIDDIIGMNEALGQMGLIYSDTGKLDESLKCYRSLIKNAENTGIKTGTAVALGNIGTIYENQGLYDKAMKCYEDAISISKEIGNRNIVNKMVNNIGIIHWRNGNVENAIANFKISLRIAIEMGDKRSAGIASSNIGGMNHKLGKYDEAIEYFMMDLNTSEKIGDKKGVSINLRNVGKAYYEQKKYDKALTNLTKAVKIAEKIKTDQTLYSFLLSRAECYLEMGDISAAKKDIQRSIRIMKKLNVKNNLYSKMNLVEHKIDFAGAKLKKDKLKVIDSAIELLKIEKGPIEMAGLNFEIAIMLKELNIDNKLYKNTAVEIYTALKQQAPFAEYIQKLDILKKV